MTFYVCHWNSIYTQQYFKFFSCVTGTVSIHSNISNFSLYPTFNNHSPHYTYQPLNGYKRAVRECTVCVLNFVLSSVAAWLLCWCCAVVRVIPEKLSLRRVNVHPVYLFDPGSGSRYITHSYTHSPLWSLTCITFIETSHPIPVTFRYQFLYIVILHFQALFYRRGV
jgi:hypothetical protein